MEEDYVRKNPNEKFLLCVYKSYVELGVECQNPVCWVDCYARYQGRESFEQENETFMGGLEEELS